MTARWSDEDVVEALYRGILQRPSDPSGLAAHVEHLSNNRGRQALVDVAEGFLSSPEFTVRLNEAQFAPIQRAMEATPKIEVEPIRHVMSVGASCSTSAMLQRWWLRWAAGPFDWTFSSLRMVEHVLRDDFRTFLDPTEMEATSIEGRKATHHRFYASMADYVPGHQGEPVFLHHDVLQDHAAHFERAVDRSRSMLRERTLLVGVYQDLPGLSEAFSALAGYLTSAAPLTRLIAFVAQPTPGALMPEITLRHADGHHRLYLIRSLDAVGETGFLNIYDEMAAMRAIHQYRFDLAT